MTTASNLTTEMVLELAPDAKSAQAGMQLVQKNKFTQLQVSLDGTKLAALCQGSDPQPYQLAADFAFPSRSGPILFAGCNCASYKQPCKHVLGMMLCYIESPEKFAEANVASPSEGYRLEPTRKEPKAVAPANWDKATETFLGAILAEPDDDTPRLVFADWLEEHGDLDRATFIRLQCEVARLWERDPRWGDLQDQVEKLWKKHRKGWLTPLPMWLRRLKPEFRRGFLEKVTVSANQFLRYANAMFKVAPIRTLEITDLGGRAALLAACPRLDQIAELHVIRQSFSSDVLRVLLNTPFLKRLRSLWLNESDIGLAGVRELTSVPFLSGLEYLELRSCSLRSSAIRLLLDWPVVRQLRWLELSYNNFDNSIAPSIVALMSQALPHLVVKLTYCGIGARAMIDLGERFGDRIIF
jgi:uncharacterized protein (TIGR02996 family)